MRHFTLPSLLLAAGAVTAAPHALADACDASWGQAQTAQKQNRLLNAREQYQQCINTCTEQTAAHVEAAKDCSGTLKKLEQDIPTVVLIATDKNGERLSDVNVVMDGRSLASRLDGNAVEVDPGAHFFLFKYQDKTTTLESTVGEGQRNQEIKVVFESVGKTTPAVPPPAAVDPNARHVAFSTEDSAEWELASSEGKLICALPCSAPLSPDKGYQVRAKGGGPRTTFLGSAAGGSSATVAPPRGSRFYSGLTVIVSGALVGIGAGLYFAGDTQKCGYGKTTDADGNEKWTKEVDGKCGENPPPDGFPAASGTNIGDTAKGNEKAGIAMAALGGAGMVVGGIWWLASSSDPSITWKRDTARKPGRKIGIQVTPTSVGVLGTW